MSQRALPAAVEAERALLGGLQVDPQQVPTIGERLRPDDFFRDEHGRLYALLLDMSARGEHIDPITVPERVVRGGEAERFGGVAYVLELRDHVPATANLDHYAAVIREKSVLRKLIGLTQQVGDRAWMQPEDVDELLSQAAEGLTKIGQEQGQRSWQPVSVVVDQEMLRIEGLLRNQRSVAGSTTGYKDLDDKLAGFHPTDLVILAARPAMGKTALALNLALHVAARAGKAVGVFSLEMSRGQLVTRLLCNQGLVDAGRVRTGRLDESELTQLVDASEVVRALQIRIDDTPSLSVSDVRTRARRLKAEMPDLGLIVIDYLQLMRGEDGRASREQQISAISRGLKAMAKDLDCTVLALSQLNRGVEARAEKRPLVSDLRESGAIEQDADVILFIYRDDYYNPESADRGLAEVIIAKQRNGPTGTVKLVFQGAYARFDSFAERGLVLD